MDFPFGLELISLQLNASLSWSKSFFIDFGEPPTFGYRIRFAILFCFEEQGQLLRYGIDVEIIVNAMTEYFASRSGDEALVAGENFPESS